MKKIGLIGGVTWVSTTEYYKRINQKINKHLGGHHSAEVVINSVDFAEVIKMLMATDWDGIQRLLTEKAIELKKSGVDFIAIGSNTMAKVGQSVSENVGIEIVEIFESTAIEINKLGLKKVALLGTRFTMEDRFYIEELKRNRVHAIVPNPEEIEVINNIILTELTKEIFTVESKNIFLQIINKLKKQEGIDGVILGCTEIPLLIKNEDASLPLFDTTEIHTEFIVRKALA